MPMSPDAPHNDRRAVAERDWLQQPQHSLLQSVDPAFPSLLHDIPGPPSQLYVHGSVEVLQLPAIAIVGSRNPTAAGRDNAFEFARHLASCGFAIVSGLAQGIDTAAHEGALDAGGVTIALLGHGIDRVYPAANRDLAHRIAGSGALVSEYSLGTEPERWRFPDRNRLISGLSLGTLVVEAARRSGSLITARLAAEQGREVFAIPGSIHNPLSRGCHQLIRDGARLVESSDDIVAELGELFAHLQHGAPVDTADTGLQSDDDEYATLRQHLGHDPVSTDELVRRSGLTIDQVSSMLLILELNGEVEKLSGGQFALLS